MDLKSFISEAITQIAEGIIDASERTKDTSAIVSPGGVTANLNDTGPYGFYSEDSDKWQRHVQKIEFDVVVTAGSGTETKGGIGIHVGAVGIGSSGKSENSNTSESRIRFHVPVVLPESPRKNRSE
ncbi:hypothetical protein [Roseiconus lacunae]|uniref:HK97 gp10 family phage protein n=1 Tax=Roseiconus lacunae TaxID=2605694 RepID=A0ABT7PGA0_9BACT|nr:hypothetical protein [Roseiconus lacunae]MDM4015281.1 hypothetical protein [Roseiconus lacunae]